MTTQQKPEEKKKMLLGLDLHTAVRAACLGQISSIPLGLIAGAIANAPLAIVAGVIVNPAVAAAFAGLGVAAYKFFFQGGKEPQEKVVPSPNVISIHYGTSLKALKNKKRNSR